MYSPNPPFLKFSACVLIFIFNFFDFDAHQKVKKETIFVNSCSLTLYLLYSGFRSTMELIYLTVHWLRSMEKKIRAFSS